MKCEACEGCGQVANDEDKTPWSVWLNIPFKSSMGREFAELPSDYADERIETGE